MRCKCQSKNNNAKYSPLELRNHLLTECEDFGRNMSINENLEGPIFPKDKPVKCLSCEDCDFVQFKEHSCKKVQIFESHGLLPEIEFCQRHNYLNKNQIPSTRVVGVDDEKGIQKTLFDKF